MARARAMFTGKCDDDESTAQALGHVLMQKLDFLRGRGAITKHRVAAWGMKSAGNISYNSAAIGRGNVQMDLMSPVPIALVIFRALRNTFLFRPRGNL